jgi:formyltetrahydrofolate deformylase
LIDCPDRKGLVAGVANLIYECGGNILHADQHQDQDAKLFFMRVEWELEGFDLEKFRTLFRQRASELQLHWRLEMSSVKPKIAIFVSQYLHCLIDLLQRHKADELNCTIPLIFSNHQDARAIAQFNGISFHYVPVHRDEKRSAEQHELELLEAARVDVVVLARYMQVLSPDFVAKYPSRIINVHRSFLPGFIGAKPYSAAFGRGVKLIAATSHYVTTELDEGPIIEQDVSRVSHRDQVPELIAKGRDLERVVLSRALRWQLEHRILCYGNKTVIFD